MKKEDIPKELKDNETKALQNYKDSGVITQVEILTTKDSCGECKK